MNDITVMGITSFSLKCSLLPEALVVVECAINGFDGMCLANIRSAQ